MLGMSEVGKILMLGSERSEEKGGPWIGSEATAGGSAPRLARDRVARAAKCPNLPPT